MGWGLRKSVKLGGGMRLNFSKSGLGLSAGVKGARVSFGPKGTRLYGGVGPLRYQSGLSNKTTRLQRNVAANDESAISDISVSLPKGMGCWFWLISLFMPVSVMIWKESPDQHGFWIMAYLGWALWLFLGIKKVKNEKNAYALYQQAQQTENIDERIQLLTTAWQTYQKAPYQIALVDELIKSKRYEEARNHLEKLENTYPVLFVLVAECLIGEGKYDLALAKLPNPDSLKNNMRRLIVLKVMAEAFRGKKEFDRSLECVKEGLRRRGEEIVDLKRELRVLEAQILNDSGQKEKAKKLLSALLADVPEFELAKNALRDLNK